MASEFARDTVISLCSLPEHWADEIDTQLQEVREALEALSRRRLQGRLCWCFSRTVMSGEAWMDPDVHEEDCERARKLYERLQIEGE